MREVKISAQRAVAIALLLAVATLIVYSRVGAFEYNNYDDQDYVSENPMVQQGLTWVSMRWAFTTGFASNWHPLTWLSLMLDCHLFGVNPGVNHWMNVGWHIAGSILLFLALWRMTGAEGRSAFVAALFALHPLHVESVAWVAERKDVLSGFFWMLTLMAYAHYAAKPKLGRYVLVVACFALGLMAKPMLVTLPFVLLLLDLWPLGRWCLFASEKDGAPESCVGLRSLVLEKIPLFLLTAASSVVTFIVQQRGGAVESFEKYPFGVRVANALVSYVAYLGKTILPEDLAVLYPHPGSWPLWQAGGAGVLLLFITLAAVALARRSPYLPVGWLWYLGTLVPVIGLVQVGAQWMADRYTYIPLVGVFIMVAWGAWDLLGSWPFRKVLVAAGTAVVLMACMAASWLQVQHWRSSVTLFRHAVAVTTNNPIAHYNLGQALSMAGQLEEPLEHYQEALRLKPGYDLAHNNLGLTLARMGRLTEATNHYAAAVRINPRNAEARFNFGVALSALGQHAAAAEQFQTVLDLMPVNPVALHAFGKALQAQGDMDQAVAAFEQALQWRPDFPEAHYDLGSVRLSQGRFGEASRHFEQTARLRPAVPAVHAQWGIALARQGKPREAMLRYQEAIRLQPDHLEALNNLAWMLATHPAAEFRNGAEAVQLAERACERTAYKVPVLVGTLAAAYAEAGRYDKAVETARKAQALAKAAGLRELAERNAELEKLYASRAPYRETL